MPKKSVPPSIIEVAFDCPHCGAYTTQMWFDLHITARPEKSRTPRTVSREFVEDFRLRDLHEKLKADMLVFYEKVLTGLIFFEKYEGGKYIQWGANNLHLSKCYSCNEIAVWVHDRLLFPPAGEGPPPNADLPDSIRLDYEEASRILNLSPRGSAALLRLAIQKLCAELGETGENINEDIASLVKKGLAPLVQRALDSVRVIGNEAVHPGQLDLKDDRDTANQLFRLVNIIAEQMISNPKHVDELYAKLPEAKREAIEKRDGKQISSEGSAT